ncbi:secreted serine-threonine mucin [Cryptosporidium felis]|nr:secreted serine-threonine mucin [Cryptosporidium felis]
MRCARIVLSLFLIYVFNGGIPKNSALNTNKFVLIDELSLIKLKSSPSHIVPKDGDASSNPEGEDKKNPETVTTGRHRSRSRSRSKERDKETDKKGPRVSGTDSKSKTQIGAGVGPPSGRRATSVTQSSSRVPSGVSGSPGTPGPSKTPKPAGKTGGTGTSSRVSSGGTGTSSRVSSGGTGTSSRVSSGGTGTSSRVSSGGTGTSSRVSSGGTGTSSRVSSGGTGTSPRVSSGGTGTCPRATPRVSGSLGTPGASKTPKPVSGARTTGTTGTSSRVSPGGAGASPRVSSGVSGSPRAPGSSRTPRALGRTGSTSRVTGNAPTGVLSKVGSTGSRAHQGECRGGPKKSSPGGPTSKGGDKSSSGSDSDDFGDSDDSDDSEDSDEDLESSTADVEALRARIHSLIKDLSAGSISVLCMEMLAELESSDPSLRPSLKKKDLMKLRSLINGWSDITKLLKSLLRHLKNDSLSLGCNDPEKLKDPALRKMCKEIRREIRKTKNSISRSERKILKLLECMDRIRRAARRKRHSSRERSSTPEDSGGSKDKPKESDKEGESKGTQTRVTKRSKRSTGTTSDPRTAGSGEEDDLSLRGAVGGHDPGAGDNGSSASSTGSRSSGSFSPSSLGPHSQDSSGSTGDVSFPILQEELRLTEKFCKEVLALLSITHCSHTDILVGALNRFNNLYSSVSGLLSSCSSRITRVKDKVESSGGASASGYNSEHHRRYLEGLQQRLSIYETKLSALQECSAAIMELILGDPGLSSVLGGIQLLGQDQESGSDEDSSSDSGSDSEDEEGGYCTSDMSECGGDGGPDPSSPGALPPDSTKES